MDDVIIEKLEWSAPEYHHKVRSIDFFWAIGLASIIGAALAVWMHDYLFAVFIFVSGFCLVLFYRREPQDITFVIETSGITLGRTVYPWKSIMGFHIKKDEPFAKLMIATDRKFLPVHTVALPSDLIGQVKSQLLKVIPDVDMEESQSTLFMEKIGF
jgi:uncharacterized membrane protein